MPISARFAMAAHVLGMLALRERAGAGPATSEVLAASVNTNPVVVRRIIGELRRAGLVRTRRGVGGGAVLARAPDAITLRQVYEAVAEPSPLLPCAPGTPKTRCDLGARAHEVLGEVVADAEEALRVRLARTTVADLADRIEAGSPCRGAG
ncbi:MAG: Rrf2 family transcriptional regulator [Deltaproteobacteria bacterium]|nr:MAG: Rrf2 family transcriptional regulator [Deltaproteobacteria bacterium]